ncbi:hypothetical protein IL306_008948 [Fusarium sp. DS 682]|nr:hypothetical protein IL306_008948 [Fusarium sp. DS 682]
MTTNYQYLLISLPGRPGHYFTDSSDPFDPANTSHRGAHMSAYLLFMRPDSVDILYSYWSDIRKLCCVSLLRQGAAEVSAQYLALETDRQLWSVWFKSFLARAGPKWPWAYLQRPHSLAPGDLGDGHYEYILHQYLIGQEDFGSLVTDNFAETRNRLEMEFSGKPEREAMDVLAKLELLWFVGCQEDDIEAVYNWGREWRYILTRKQEFRSQRFSCFGRSCFPLETMPSPYYRLIFKFGQILRIESGLRVVTDEKRVAEEVELGDAEPSLPTYLAAYSMS